MSEVVYVTRHGAESIEASLRKLIDKASLPTSRRKIIFAIGGDGTLMRAIRSYLADDAIFIGVSAGTLGFLQTIQQDQLDEVVDALSTNSYNLIQAPLLAVSYESHPYTVLAYAFNDVSIERSGPQAVKFNLDISEASGSFIGDGVVFSTPLGSTAYSLAAGGPIIDAAIQDVFVTTPINPHFSAHYSSLQRPHVLRDDRTVHLKLDKEALADRPMRIMADGFTVVKNLKANTQVFMSDRHIQIMQLVGQGYHDQIEAKRLSRY